MRTKKEILKLVTKGGRFGMLEFLNLMRKEGYNYAKHPIGALPYDCATFDYFVVYPEGNTNTISEINWLYNDIASEFD